MESKDNRDQESQIWPIVKYQPLRPFWPWIEAEKMEETHEKTSIEVTQKLAKLSLKSESREHDHGRN